MTSSIHQKVTRGTLSVILLVIVSMTALLVRTASPALASIAFTSPLASSALNNNHSLSTSMTSCHVSSPNRLFDFAPGFVGAAQPNSVISLSNGSRQYLYAGASDGTSAISGVSWTSDLRLSTNLATNPTISIGRTTTQTGRFNAGSTSSVAIAGIAVTGYSISKSFRNYTRSGDSHSSSSSSIPGPTLSLKYSVPSPGDVVVILVAGQGAGLLKSNGMTLPTLINDTYSECGHGAIASVGIFAGTPGMGVHSMTFASTTYSGTFGSTLGAVAYVLTPMAATGRSRPGPPLNVSATTNNSQVSVAWSPPINNGNDAVTSYIATATPGGRTCRYLVTATATDKCTIRQLHNGVSYTISVNAANSMGIGASSAPLDGVIPTSGTPVVNIFDDEFNGPLSSAWTVAHGSNPSNDELQCYSPLNVTLSGGLLHEKAALGKKCGAYCPPTSHAACPYVSGGVQWSRLSFTYGTISVRAKMPGGVGTWPAVWLLGANCQRPSWLSSRCDWPAPGSNEIDIAEILGSIQNRVNQRIHTQYPDGTPAAMGCDPLVTNVANNWHTYTLIWAPGSLTWEVDHVATCRITTLVPDTPMFLIINTAVGGVGVGRVKNSTLPKTTQIDFVRVTKSLAT